ncbi:hypothetical protein RAS1_01370 [Phycisphaerae bacterium RAS1]|nr:hypothetical protein RAS1_01370 [Phycisphaerae bacterium RAS1]
MKLHGKSLAITLLLATFAPLLGCGSKIPPPGPNGIKEKAFIGTWREETGKDIGQSMTAPGGDATPLRQVSFTDDGKYKMIFVKKDGAPTDAAKFVEGTWAVSGDKCTITITNNKGVDPSISMGFLLKYVYKDKANDKLDHIFMSNETDDSQASFARVEK